MSNLLKKMHEKVTEKRDALRKHRAALKAHEAKLQALFADVEAIGGEPYSDADWIFIPVTGDKHTFLALARLIRKHGFTMPKVEKGETGFTALNYLGEGDTSLAIYFQFSSSVCRRVKVGTKTVEQDVYETVCDELMPYGDQPSSAPAQAPTEDTYPILRDTSGENDER